MQVWASKPEYFLSIFANTQIVRIC